MGSGAGKPFVSPTATPAYTFCYTGADGRPNDNPAAPSANASPPGGGRGIGVTVQTGSELGGDRPRSRARPTSRPTSRAASGRPSSQQSSYGEPVDDNCNMVCEACSTSFHVFKRKYRCSDCDKYYCSDCFIKDPRKWCAACSAVHRSPSRAELMTLKIKDLRLYLNTHSVSTQSCTEKDDLVDLVIQYVQAHPNPRATAGVSSSRSSNVRSPGNRASHPQASQQPGQQPGQRASQRFEEMFNDIFSRLSPNQGTGSSVDPPNLFPTGSSNTQGQRFNSTNASASSGNEQRPQSRTAWTRQNPATTTTTNTTSTPTQRNMPSHQTNQVPQETEQTPVEPLRRRASLSDVDTVDGIDSLSIKQLKEILTANFVDYKGCVERWELKDRVKRLYEERQQRKKKEEKVKEQGNVKESEGEPMDADDEDSLCKICMDAEIDCVLLECGHMVTCTNCGKRMNECPICRQYVVRAVHIFRA